MAGCNCAAIRPRRLVEQEPATSPPFVPGLHRAHATNPFHSHSSDPPHAAAPSLHNTPHRHHHCTPAKPSGLGIRFPARSTRALLSSSSPSLLVGACPNPSERDCSAGAGGGGPALFMKVLCSACEAAEASVLCCADDAALCARCDRDVHAANRLAGKHQRLPLLAPGAQSAAAAVSPPKCDICQECDAYFFCLEDRALLCRSCDVAVHTANAFVSAHRRFLLTGVQVGKELDDPAPEQPEPPPPPPPPPPPAKSDPAPPPLYSDSDFAWAAGVTETLADWSAVSDQFPSPAPRHAEPASRATPPKRSPWAPAFAAGQGRVAGGVMDWPLGEFFRGVSDFNGGGFSFGESGTSKADSGKLGGSAGGSPYYRSSSEDREANDLFGMVPEIQWSVPELPSPPTASGLHWQHGGGPDSTAFVPDICSPDSAVRRCFPTAAAAAAKRQRNR